MKRSRCEQLMCAGGQRSWESSGNSYFTNQFGNPAYVERVMGSRKRFLLGTRGWYMFRAEEGKQDDVAD